MMVCRNHSTIIEVSIIGAHVYSEIGSSICLRHLFWSTSIVNYFRQDLFSFTWANRIPSNHLIWIAWCIGSSFLDEHHIQFRAFSTILTIWSLPPPGLTEILRVHEILCIVSGGPVGSPGCLQYLLQILTNLTLRFITINVKKTIK